MADVSKVVSEANESQSLLIWSILRNLAT